MEQLFDLFLQKELKGETSILDAYSKLHGVKRSWLSSKQDLTIQELVDNICDDLESQGYDLSTTSTDEIKDRFILWEVLIKAPAGYKELVHAKNITEIALKNINSSDVDPKYKKQISSMLDLIESNLKDLG